MANGKAMLEDIDISSENTRVMLEDVFSEDMLQAVQDVDVALAPIIIKNENGKYQDRIRPEIEFEKGTFEYKDIDADWYWTHFSKQS